MPDHPALVIAATAAEAVILQRIRVVAMARMAMLQESRMLQAGLDPVGPLRALAERHPASEAIVALGFAAWREARHAAMPRALKLETAHVVSALCKSAGFKACSRTALRVVPVVGAVTGAVARARAVWCEIEEAFSDLAPTAAHPVANVPVPLRRVPSRRRVARRVAVEVVAAAIRTGDVLAAAVGRSRGSISALLAEARARARISRHSECMRITAQGMRIAA